jgi:crotonobetaine/carnitine-CoA ligase
VALAHPAGDGEDDVRVVLVLRPVMQASTALPDLAAWLRPRLPASMLPRYWETLEVLPVTPSEKVDRRALRERGLGQGSWDRER